MVYTVIFERIPLMLTTSKGAPYCNCNVNSGTETYAAYLIFIWQPVTTSNSQEFSVLFICCKL